jgi:hypothetical protein
MFLFLFAVFPEYKPETASKHESYLMMMYKSLDMLTLTAILFSPPNNSVEVMFIECALHAH